MDTLVRETCCGRLPMMGKLLVNVVKLVFHILPFFFPIAFFSSQPQIDCATSMSWNGKYVPDVIPVAISKKKKALRAQVQQK